MSTSILFPTPPGLGHRRGPPGSVPDAAGKALESFLLSVEVAVVLGARVDSSSQSRYRGEIASVRDISQCESNEERPKAAR